ncbi:MAG: chorismate synthase [Lachnospiraceae bacterium]|nr:chorismate synthase [Lachnospiraceae bacterium]
MAGNSFGKLYRVTTFGESHGKALGAIIDGCPSNLSLSEEDIQLYLNRRRPNDSDLSTPRKEKDKVEILSGVFEGKTLGTPICALVRNEDIVTSEYGTLKNIFRPGHADYTYEKKYGIRDYRSGGRSSGRETIGRVIGGAIAIKALKEKNITVTARGNYDLSRLSNGADEVDYENVEDSIGGIVECVVKGCPAGLGEPVFEKLDAELAKACMSIGAVKGVEIGAGFDVAGMLGSENNDQMTVGEKFLSNNAGGILGGISNGNDIVIRLAIKPTPTIAKKQKTIDIYGNETEVELKGRNDVCIVDRVVVVVESMVAMTILDYYLQNINVQNI